MIRIRLFDPINDPNNADDRYCRYVQNLFCCSGTTYGNKNLTASIYHTVLPHGNDSCSSLSSHNKDHNSDMPGKELFHYTMIDLLLLQLVSEAVQIQQVLMPVRTVYIYFVFHS